MEIIMECCGKPESKCTCEMDELTQLLFEQDGHHGNVAKSDYLEKYQEMAMKQLGVEDV